MGAFFIFFLGDNELKEMRVECLNKLARTKKASKVDYLTRKLEAINAEITRRGLK